MRKTTIVQPFVEFRKLVLKSIRAMRDDNATIESVLAQLEQKRLSLGLSVDEAKAIIAELKPQ